MKYETICSQKNLTTRNAKESCSGWREILTDGKSDLEEEMKSRALEIVKIGVY